MSTPHAGRYIEAALSLSGALVADGTKVAVVATGSMTLASLYGDRLYMSTVANPQPVAGGKLAFYADASVGYDLIVGGTVSGSTVTGGTVVAADVRAVFDPADYGQNGTAGSNGTNGSNGAAGAPGPVPWSPPAAWNSTTTYTAGPPASVVTYQGATYVATAGSTNVAPPSDSTKWALVAAAGSSTYAALTDVNVTGLADGMVPVWNAASSSWRMVAAPGNGELAAAKNVTGTTQALAAGGSVDITGVTITVPASNGRPVYLKGCVVGTTTAAATSSLLAEILETTGGTSALLAADVRTTLAVNGTAASPMVEFPLGVVTGTRTFKLTAASGAGAFTIQNSAVFPSWLAAEAR